MRFDRRQFLVATGAVAVGCPAPSDDSDPSPEPAPTRDPSPTLAPPPLPVDEARFPRGVVVGDPTQDAALVIVHTDAQVLDLVWQWADGPDWVPGDRLADVAVVDGVARAQLSGLPADAAIAVHAESQGVASAPTRFRTAADGLRKIRIGATSCLGGANPGLGNLAHIPQRDVDLMLLLGDTVYADGSVTADDFRAYWDALFAKPAARALFAGAAVLATWDDHEVSNNWTLGEGSALEDAVTHAQLAAGTDVWRESTPMRDGPGGTGVWRQAAWGPHLDLFVLDCRGERAAGQMISPEQLAWLTQGLRASSARFKLVLVSVHMTDHFELMSIIADKDRWQGYPQQRVDVVLAAAEVPGVVFITGDMHFGSVQRVDPVGGPGAGLYEIAAGPSGSRLFPVDGVAQAMGGLPAQYETIVEDWSWCDIELDPGTGEVMVRFVGDDGTDIASQRFVV